MYLVWDEHGECVVCGLRVYHVSACSMCLKWYMSGVWFVCILVCLYILCTWCGMYVVCSLHVCRVLVYSMYLVGMCVVCDLHVYHVSVCSMCMVWYASGV